MASICLCYLLTMRLNTPFWIISALLVGLGGWGLSKIVLDQSAKNVIKTNLETSKRSKQTISVNPTYTQQSKTGESQKPDDELSKIQTLIKRNRPDDAANAINDSYSSLSIKDLDRLKNEFISLALSQHDKTDQQQMTLAAASKVFDDIDIWLLLSNSAAKNQDWPLAHKAQVRASQLESDSSKLDQHYKKLFFTAGKLRTGFENSGDEISINGLYSELNLLHPSVPRFQLELAFSHLRLNDTVSAEALLLNLSYDNDFGAIAQRTLDKITESIAPIKPEAPITSRTEIVVPLIASGSSFLINVAIDQRQTRLLLDTGASITALSKDLIATLNLKDTGNTISISTANGIKTARLYKTRRLELGRLVLQNMTIAEIDLAPNNRFQGLLGTDVLNQLGDYNYLIDKQRSALIFVK